MNLTSACRFVRDFSANIEIFPKIACKIIERVSDLEFPVLMDVPCETLGFNENLHRFLTKFSILTRSRLIRRPYQTGSSTPDPEAFGRAEKENPGLKVLSGKNSF